MLALLSLLSLLGCLTTFTSATALTYKLFPNEKECFYTHVAKEGAKVAFYFAVQSGGSFDSTSRPGSFGDAESLDARELRPRAGADM